MGRLDLLPLALLFALPPALCTAAQPAAPAYPSKPIRFIVPFAPGGTNDIVARIVGAQLGESWGQPVVVDNRGGAGGVIGTDLGAKAPPDGYTLLMANVNFATNPVLVKKLPYDTLKDFQPVSLLATSPSVLVVHPSFPASSVKELIAVARSKPGQLNYSSSGAGTTGHIAMELFKQMAKVDMVPVHYKGGGPALIDLLAGRVSPGFATILSVVPHLKAGRLRALAVSTPKRSPALPDIPTVAESGLAGYEFTGWWGMVVPANTPRQVVSKLNAELGRLLDQPEVRGNLVKQGAEPEHTTPGQFSAFIKSEIAKLGKVVKDANITIN
jgi:tripartite-type tricarboxylate transporter receptor subunit TctC